jgi:hypothetical protein
MVYLIAFLVLYVLATVVAAYLLTDGFKIDFSGTALVLIAIMWPVFLYLIAISWFEERRLRRKRQNGD